MYLKIFIFQNIINIKNVFTVTLDNVAVLNKTISFK